MLRKTCGRSGPGTVPSDRRRQHLAVVGTALVGLLLSGQGHAAADARATMLLGHATGDLNSTDCTPGSFLVGAHVWVESRNYTTAVQAICRNSDGDLSDADIAGSPWAPTVLDSTCNAGYAAGLYGRVGDVLDAAGLRCGGSPGAAAALAGGDGGELVGPADCPAGAALTGLVVHSTGYHGATDLFGISGTCTSLHNWSGVQAPVSPDGSGSFPAGSIVPVRFTATDSAGEPDPSISAVLAYAPLTGDVVGAYHPASGPGSVRRVEEFRYEPGTGQYLFDWSTRGIAPGRYRLRITTSYGAVQTVDLALR
jgi:hypothetical protein